MEQMELKEQQEQLEQLEQMVNQPMIFGLIMEILEQKLTSLNL